MASKKNAELIRKIKQMYAQGEPTGVIARTLGVSEAYVVSIVRPYD